MSYKKKKSTLSTRFLVIFLINIVGKNIKTIALKNDNLMSIYLIKLDL